MSVLLIERRLTALVGHPCADLRQFGANLMHHGVDATIKFTKALIEAHLKEENASDKKRGRKSKDREHG